VLLARAVCATVDLPGSLCKSETGPGSRQHQRALDILGGHVITFIGDSVTRYQYLELAYYLARGVCPADEDEQSVTSEMQWGGWHAFYRGSSALLNHETDSGVSSETCFCTRAELAPGRVHELRSFRYDGAQVRVPNAHVHLKRCCVTCASAGVTARCLHSARQWCIRTA
jgi:hypothetical protein